MRHREGGLPYWAARMGIRYEVLRALQQDGMLIGEPTGGGKHMRYTEDLICAALRRLEAEKKAESAKRKEAKRERDNERNRLYRRAKADAEGRSLRKKAPNGQGMTREQRAVKNAERRNNKSSATKLHDAHVRQYKRQYKKRAAKPLESQSTLHDAHVRKWRAVNATRNRERMKYHSTPAHNLYHRIKRWMHKHLGNRLPSRQWAEYLGYTPDDLRAHLERQFTKGMGWHNKGKWHIDHIVPVSAFSFESAEDIEFKRCFALANLRPMWAKENLIKSNRITTLL